MIPAKKTKTAFFCSQCGAEHPRWQGQCRECSAWNSLIEERLPDRKKKKAARSAAPTQTLAEISNEALSGFVSGIDELDRVLGGQLLPGMTVLLGGDPGIGKSTLVLQAADNYARRGLNVLYVTGEESLPQIKMRSERLGVAEAQRPHLPVVPTHDHGAGQVGPLDVHLLFEPVFGLEDVGAAEIEHPAQVAVQHEPRPGPS